MLRSRMFTTAFRFFAALSMAAIVGAVVSAMGSDTDQGLIDRVVGPLTIGWKGGVGDHLAYTTLLGVAVVAAALAVLHVAFRDADPEAEAQLVHTDAVPLTRAPTGTNFLPLVAAFGVGVVLIGLITNKYVVIAGLTLLVIVVGVWALRAWAERATGDDEVNTQLYERFIEPFRIPVLSIVCIGVVALGSRGCSWPSPRSAPWWCSSPSARASCSARSCWRPARPSPRTSSRSSSSSAPS